MITLRNKVMKHRERYRSAFIDPLAMPFHCYEMIGGQGGGVGAVVVAESPSDLSLLDAAFMLLRFWRDTASQGWSGGPRKTPPEELWSDLWTLIETGYRGYASQIYRYEFTPMKVDDFDRGLRQIVDTIAFDRAPEKRLIATIDNEREVEVGEGFRPPVVGPYREAIAVLHKWNSRTFVARTDTQRICVMWSTGA